VIVDRSDLPAEAGDTAVGASTPTLLSREPSGGSPGDLVGYRDLRSRATGGIDYVTIASWLFAVLFGPALVALVVLVVTWVT
jgi:hypothetical protein